MNDEPRSLIDWEVIGPFRRLERIRVPGGWLYRTVHAQSVALCFVPDATKAEPRTEDDGSLPGETP
jgi:hypothetical protein